MCTDAQKCSTLSANAHTQTHRNVHKYGRHKGGGRQTITHRKIVQECKAKGNGQFVKSGKSGEADRTVGLETMAEIKASLAKGGL